MVSASASAVRIKQSMRKLPVADRAIFSRPGTRVRNPAPGLPVLVLLVLVLVLVPTLEQLR